MLYTCNVAPSIAIANDTLCHTVLNHVVVSPVLIQYGAQTIET